MLLEAGGVERTAAADRPRGRRAQWADWLGSQVFILPNFLGFLTFTLLPVLASLCLSFVKWDVVRPVNTAQFVGLGNFKHLLGFHLENGLIVANDTEFWYYVYNTLFLMLGIPVSIFSSLFLALVMNQRLRGIVFYRAVFFLPTVCPAIAVCLLWQWIYNGEWGLLNQALAPVYNFVNSLFGTHWRPPQWLTNPQTAKPAFILLGLWAGIGGYNCILYLAGLQQIPQELYEAADLDGANWWHKLRHVTWPMLSPTTFFIAIMSVIHGFQGGFTTAYIMTQGGPAGATTTIVYYIYNQGFRYFHMGYAASIAWVLFVVVFVATLINWKYGGRRVTYL